MLFPNYLFILFLKFSQTGWEWNISIVTKKNIGRWRYTLHPFRVSGMSRPLAKAPGRKSQKNLATTKNVMWKEKESRRRPVTGEKMVDESSSGGKINKKTSSALIPGGVTSLAGSTNRPGVIMTAFSVGVSVCGLGSVSLVTRTHLDTGRPGSPGLCRIQSQRTGRVAA